MGQERVNQIRCSHSGEAHALTSHVFYDEPNQPDTSLVGWLRHSAIAYDVNMTESL